MNKKFIVLDGFGQQYVATGWSVACQIAAEIVKREGEARIIVNLTRDTQS